MTRVLVDPPSPPGLPTRSQLRALRDGPHEFLRDLAGRYGPVVRFPLGPLEFVLATHPDDVRRVLIEEKTAYTKDTFQYRLLRDLVGDGLLTLDGPEWLRRRRMEQPSFHRAAVDRWQGMMQAAAESVATRWDELAGGPPVDVSAEMMQVALRIVARALFDVDVRDQADSLATATLEVLHHLIARARRLGLVPEWLPTAGNRRYRRARAALDDAIYATIRQRRARSEPPPDDLLARLMAVGRDDGETSWTDAELRDEMLTMIIAGHETVASAMSWTWYLLATHPEVDARVGETARDPGVDSHEPGYVDRVFLETLRLYPPAWIVTRRAERESTLGEYRIPSGMLVVLSPYVTQRHPALWDRPDVFDPDRFLPERSADRHRYAHFPFGAGPHLCIGNHFAMLEARVVLGCLGGRFRLELAGNREVRPDPGVTLVPEGGLWMRIHRRE